MTTRTLAAETTGPITINASLLRHHGAITVRAERDCDRATLTIHTTDEDGPAADAVRGATLSTSDAGLYTSVQGSGGSGGTTIITGDGGGTTVVQSFGTVTGSVTGMVASGNHGAVVQIGGNAVGGDVIVNGRRISGSGGTTVIQGSAPIQITAVVPEGSSVLGRTQSADVEALGALLNVTADTQSGDVRADTVNRVTANTQSGDVRVGQAAQINAGTQSGDIRLNRVDVVQANTMSGDITIADFGATAQLTTMSGDIRVHATAGGGVNASTMSGDIDVTATQDAINAGLDVQTRTMSGRVRAPQRHR